MDKFLFFQLRGRAGFCHYKFYLDFLHCPLFRFFDKESRLEDINLKLSINRNSRLTIDSLPSLFIKLSTTTSLLNDIYFSSLFGMHLIFSPWPYLMSLLLLTWSTTKSSLSVLRPRVESHLSLFFGSNLTSLTVLK